MENLKVVIIYNIFIAVDSKTNTDTTKQIITPFCEKNSDYHEDKIYMDSKWK